MYNVGQSIKEWTKQNLWKTPFERLWPAYPFKLFKGSVPEILIGSFLNTLSRVLCGVGGLGDLFTKYSKSTRSPCFTKNLIAAGHFFSTQKFKMLKDNIFILIITMCRVLSGVRKFLVMLLLRNTKSFTQKGTIHLVRMQNFPED